MKKIKTRMNVKTKTPVKQSNQSTLSYSKKFNSSMMKHIKKAGRGR